MKSSNPETILVNDIYYDTQKLANFHPGGNLFIDLFAGKDATEVFHAYHRRPFPHSTMEKYKTMVKPPMTTTEDDPLYMELCKEVNRALPIKESFAPFSYYVKAVSLLCIAGLVEYYIHSTGSYTAINTGFLGFLFALIGLNIQHDANHGAISPHFWINRLLGFSQNWIGGSAVDWMHQHVVQHHVYCNNVFKDPDLVGSALVRLNPTKPYYCYHILQAFYISVLFLFFGFFYSMDSLYHYYEMRNFTDYSPYIAKYADYDRMVSLLFVVRWLVFPCFFSPYSFIQTVLRILPLFGVGGYYLAFFFVLSHNYNGVLHYDDKYAKKMGLLKRQVLTSSNVGGQWLCELNGGLNYQIEHHLFPRIHHSHYPKIAPIVKAFCKKHNIQYTHFNTLQDNIISCMEHLTCMGFYTSYSTVQEKGKYD